MREGREFEFGSDSEAMAILVLSRDRNAEFIKPLFNVVDPEKTSSLVRQYRGILFPEEKYSDLEYVAKARRMFERLQKVDFYVKPLG